MLLIFSSFSRQTNINKIILQYSVSRKFSGQNLRHFRSIIAVESCKKSLSTNYTNFTKPTCSSTAVTGSKPTVVRLLGNLCALCSNVRSVSSITKQNGGWNKRRSRNLGFRTETVLIMGALSFLFKKKEEEDTIETTIAKALFQERKGHVREAEKLLHQALDMALKEKNQEAVTYIYDQMANMSLRQGRLEQAEASFKETLKRLISSGTEKNDPAVIEISLKLAQIYTATRRVSEAQHGFQWCIDTTEARIKAAEGSPSPTETTVKPGDKELSPSSSTDVGADDTENSATAAAASAYDIRDLKALLGMCLEGYARFFTRYKKYDDAVELYTRALSICETDLMENGHPHHECVTILNDLGTVYDLKGEYDKAKDFIRRSAKLARQLGQEESLPTILCNLASVEARLGNDGEAKRLFRKALKEAEHQENARTVLVIKNKLAQLETDIFLKRSEGK